MKKNGIAIVIGLAALALIGWALRGEHKGAPPILGDPGTQAGELANSQKDAKVNENHDDTALGGVASSGRNSVPSLPKSIWWEDTTRLEAYYKAFEEKFSTSRGKENFGFSEELKRLQELDNEIRRVPGGFPSRIEWSELGEIDGRSAHYILGLMERWEQSLPEGRTELIQNYFENDPLAVKPQVILNFLCGSEVLLTPSQTEAVQQLAFRWIGQRARLERVAFASTADRIARRGVEGGDLSPLPLDSDLRPSELASFQDTQANIIRGYQSDLANFLVASGFQVNLWKD